MADLLYVVVQPSATAAPSVAQVKAGQDGTGSAAAYASSKPASTTQPYTFDAVNLTEGTAYKSYFVWSDGVNDTAVFPAAGDAFTTLSAAIEASFSLGASLDVAPSKDTILEAGTTLSQQLDDGHGKTVDYQPETTLSLTLSDLLESQALYDAIVTLGQSLTDDHAAQSYIQSTLLLAAQMGLLTSRTLELSAEVAVALQQTYGIVGEVINGPVTLEGNLTIGTQLSILSSVTTILNTATTLSKQLSSISSANAIYETGLSLDSQQSAASGNIASIVAAINFEINEAFVTDSQKITGPVTFEGSLNIGIVQGIEALNIANLYAVTVLNHQAALTFTGANVIESAITYALQNDFVTNATITIEGLIAFGVNKTINTNVQSNLNVQTTLAHQAAIQSIAGAIYEAGLDLSAIKSISTVGFKLVVGIVTPQCRTFEITIQDRTVTPENDDRSAKLPEC